MVGISLDGDRAANDLHRRYAERAQQLRPGPARGRPAAPASGTGRSTPACSRLSTSAATRSRCTGRSPRSSRRTWTSCCPHGTWDSPPPGAGAPRRQTRYADWLIAVFDEWARRRPPGAGPDVRVHHRDLLGGASGPSRSGSTPSDVAVIETDGTIEQADSIKVAYDGAPATGLDIFRHPLDAAAAHPAIRARQRGLAGLAATCRALPRRDELRRRPVRAPLPGRQRVRQPVRLLRRPGEDHHVTCGRSRGRHGARRASPALDARARSSTRWPPGTATPARLLR